MKVYCCGQIVSVMKQAAVLILTDLCQWWADLLVEEANVVKRAGRIVIWW